MVVALSSVTIGACTGNGSDDLKWAEGAPSGATLCEYLLSTSFPQADRLREYAADMDDPGASHLERLAELSESDSGRSIGEQVQADPTLYDAFTWLIEYEQNRCA
jgi:hypothetical protein